MSRKIFPCLFLTLNNLYEAAEPVEKVPMANPDNFDTVKSQQLAGHRKPQNAQI
jgi:hypothetical protein